MKHYDKIFITSSSSFYKNNLFNEIAKRISIFVFFTCHRDETRNEDFYKGDLQFDYFFFSAGIGNQIKELRNFLRENTYKEIIFGGWDTKIAWFAALTLPKTKNASIIESSIYESNISGIKGFLKKLFVSRLHKAYPSGNLQKDLLEALAYKGEIVEYGGCGILNYQQQPVYQSRTVINKFIYVGRLIDVKNLQLLISVFNELPNLNLQIIGFGPLENELKLFAKKNITFTGAIDNVDLPVYYRQSDVFVLPSKSEPWGLVVEEALNNGTPVIVSDHVGCYKDLVTSETGLVFKSDDANSLRDAVMKICDIDFYNTLRKGVSKLNFSVRAERQVKSFI